MTALDSIHARLEDIRNNSEELELISLNAMVISIKSGDKGRAFSCITENLKRLSASMISLSNELMLEEKKLLEKNTILEKSFAASRSRYDGITHSHAVSCRRPYCRLWIAPEKIWPHWRGKPGRLFPRYGRR